MDREFVKICKMTQKELKQYAALELNAMHRKVTVGNGYVFAKGSFPVCLVAHLDTVHKDIPSKFLYDPLTTTVSSPEGIGGDDRCGVYMALKVAKMYDCSVLFCEDEEIGAVGADKFIKSEIAKGLTFNYMMEFDRKGNNDAVFYDCDNYDFEDFITKEFYKTAWGSFSDISVLAPHFKCAAVNLSCGYYNAHTKDEYVVLKEMYESISAACKILERTTEANAFEYIAAKSYFEKWGWRGWYDDYYNDYGYEDEVKEHYYIIEYLDEDDKTQWWDIFAASYEEAIGKFCIDNPKIAYDDIVDVCSDEGYLG